MRVVINIKYLIKVGIFLMQHNLNNFILSQVLNTNPTERTLFLLGTLKDQPGQAITILSPTLQNPNNLNFKQIQTVFNNDIYYRYRAQLTSQFDIQFIYPITEKHKLKYHKKYMVIKRQTGQEYEAKKDQLLGKELGHIQWVQNIVDGKTEVQRVLFRCPAFLICQDFKWADIKDIQTMHLTVIFSDPKLHSIRDLRAQHVPLLQNVQISLKEVLKNKVNTRIQECRTFFHYPPTFYRLHIHVMSLSLQSLNCRVERCHDLNLVIQNLQIKGDYYKNISLNTFIERTQ